MGLRFPGETAEEHKARECRFFDIFRKNVREYYGPIFDAHYKAIGEAYWERVSIESRGQALQAECEAGVPTA